MKKNSIEIDDPSGTLYRMMIKTAEGKMNKNEIAEILKSLAG